MQIVDGHQLVDLVDVQIVRMTDLQVLDSVVVVPVQLEVIVAGLPLVDREVAPIARMMDLQAFENAVVDMDHLQVQVVVVRQEPPAIGIAVVERVEESGQVHVRIQAVSFLGVHPNACLIMQHLEPSVIHLVQQSLQQQRRVILSGRMVLAVENAFSSLLPLVAK